MQLTVSQAEIAATIAGVAARRDMPVRALTIAYATALQESKLTDLNYGDRDSVGVFQQRPSEGWGTTRQIEDPVYASGRFFAALAAVPRYRQIPVYQAAQDVQHSADGSAYGQYATVGAQLADAFYGTAPHALWCYYNGQPGQGPAAGRREGDDVRVRPDAHPPGRRPGARRPGAAGRRGLDDRGLADHPRRSYGITDVRYRGYEWVRGHGTGKWLPRPARSRTPADPNAVVFG